MNVRENKKVSSRIMFYTGILTRKVDFIFTHEKISQIDFSRQTTSVENNYYDENYGLSNHSRFPPEISVYDGSDCLNLFFLT